MIVVCQQCKSEFSVFPSQQRKGGGKHCSYRCMGDSRKGKTNYTRTAEHKAKMSEKIKSMDLTRQSKVFKEYNLSRKGKTFEEIYGDRAEEVRAKYGKRGEENPNWKGGKHRNKYPWEFFQIRPYIIDRDGVCKNCYMTEEEHKEKYTGRGLTVHHIDYDKEHNDPKNLITLCIWCNCKANGRRQEWKTHYSALLG